MSYPNPPPNPFEFRPAGGYGDSGGPDDAPQVMNPRDILFSFAGRIRRGTWWIYGLGATLVYFVLLGTSYGIGTAIFGEDTEQAKLTVALLALPVMMATAWVNLALAVKRWHDVGKSGWWVLVNFICCIGPLWSLIANGFIPGDPRRNRYGPPQA